jgi:hypothetical protein
MSSPFNFQLCNENECLDYSATAVYYVSLSTLRNVFKFKTTEITNNELPASTFSNASADITYYLNEQLFPDINPANAMMDNTFSEGAIALSNSSTSNLMKHDYLRYLANETIGNYWLTPLMYNYHQLKQEIEQNSWDFNTNLRAILTNAYNGGNGLTNSANDETNFTKRILEQINAFQSARLTTGSNQNNKIVDTINVQPVPFIDGDSINFAINLKYPNLNDRKYRIRIQITSDSNNTNTVPIDSIANRNEYPTITSTGVPLIT